MKPTTSAPRRFRAYGVGLWRTGTYSLARIFGRYRSVHEFEFEPTLDAVLRRRSGEWTDARLRAFLRRREAARLLEMDSFFLNGCCVPALRDEHPDARFILTLRDCYSWCESTLNMFLHQGRHGRENHRIKSVAQDLLGLPWSGFEDRDAALERLDETLKTLAGFWKGWNEAVLRDLPAERVLVVRTHEISDRLEEMAAFLGVPSAALDARKSRANQAPELWRAGLFQSAGYAAVRKRIDLHCGPLMKRYFPGVGVETFCRAAR